MQDFFDRHEKVALMFSGGKDSIACLHLIKNYLDKTTVVWVNTGASFPEIEALMEETRQQVPHFLEIKTNQPESIKSKGYPVDVVPVNYTVLGQSVTSIKDFKVRSYFECCAENFWLPCDAEVRKLGITGVIRGQRQSESHRAPIKSGYVENGIEYNFPIETWSDNEVIDYLKSKDVVIDERLSMSHSSLDCWNCTAYMAESKDRFNYIKKHHPAKYQSIVETVKKIDNVLTAETSIYKGFL
jgi:3'-phosphoadenosine 5'-phosphosulfate sulfotransferase (PAPS reductase)/FAD synthetase